MSARPESAGIAGICFLACALFAVSVYFFTKLREFGPVIREWFHWLLTPQFVMGVLIGYALMAGIGWAMAADERRFSP